MTRRRATQLTLIAKDDSRLTRAKWLGLFFTMLALVAAISGCAGNASEKPQVTTINLEDQKAPTELNVSAAASLKDVLQKLAVDFEIENHAKLVFNFASSGDLQTQIEQGAPVDVFISAGKKQMDALTKDKLIDAGTRSNLLGNELVLVVPQTSKETIPTITDLVKDKDIEHVAIGIPETVPAGKYAKETLQKTGAWGDVKPKLVMAKDVRQVIEYVETGNAGAGFVYKSDVRTSAKVTIALIIPDSYHSPIVYPIAVVKDARQRELAAKFIEYLKGAKAFGVFKEFDFKPLAK